MRSSEARAARRGDPRLRRALAERSGDGPAAGRPEKAKLSRRKESCKESVQWAQKNWVGQGCWPGTRLTGLKTKELGAKVAAWLNAAARHKLGFYNSKLSKYV